MKKREISDYFFLNCLIVATLTGKIVQPTKDLQLQKLKQVGVNMTGTPDDVVIKNITEAELDNFISILKEASHWLKTEQRTMWSEEDFTVQNMLKVYLISELYLGYVNDAVAATMVLKQEDPAFWPDAKKDESLFLHKLAVRRNFAKTGLSNEMINWAKLYARKLEKQYLRLDCAADRPKLCDFYERNGFVRVGLKVMFDKYPTAFYECIIL